MVLQKGDKAPAFSLYNTDKQEVNLKDLAGHNVVLLFFPLAFTGVCTKEICEIRDDLGKYNDLGATVFGISVDTVFTLDRFKKEHNLNFDLLSDFNKDVSRAYGCLYEDFILGMKGVSKRAAFVIDEKGSLVYAEVLEEATSLPNFEGIRNSI